MSQGKGRVDEIQGEVVHEYDGIEEADNQLPRWWLLTFYGAIVFSIGYWFYYHEYQVGLQPMEAYAAALQEKAAEGGEVSEELLVALAEDSAAVKRGHGVFAENCQQCHEAQGQGKIGPNLTDAQWLHGGSPGDIFKVVNDGVGAKGMPAWGPILGGEKVQEVVAFVLSIRNTEVPGKVAEGEVWSPGAVPAAGGNDGPAVDDPAESPAGVEGTDVDGTPSSEEEGESAGKTSANADRDRFATR